MEWTGGDWTGMIFCTGLEGAGLTGFAFLKMHNPKKVIASRQSRSVNPHDQPKRRAVPWCDHSCFVSVLMCW